MSSKRSKISLLLSVTVHIFVLALAFLSSEVMQEKKEDTEIEVTFVDMDDIPSNAQVVDQSEQSLNDEIPENARFLSRHNQRVVKETRAAQTGEFTNKVGGGSAQDNTPKNDTDNQKKDQSIADVGEIPKLENLKPEFDWNQVASQGANGEERSVARTDDHIKDVDVGIQTVLNTREFVYYSYYSRIKTRLNRLWEPKIKEKMTKLMRSGRKPASTNIDRVTQLIITLDSDGVLKKVQVIGESGIRDLDDAAIEAFKAAAPFPNPPKGMIEKDGTVKIRWDFVLEA